MAKSSLDEDLRSQFGRLDFPVALIRLSDLTIVAVSDSMASHLGVAPNAMIGQHVLEFIRPEERDSSTAAVEAVRNGDVEAYHAHRKLVARGAASGLGSEWIHVFEMEGERFLLVEGDPGTKRHPRPLTAYLGEEPAGMVIGGLDADLVIRTISSDIEDALSLPAQEVVGQRLTDLVEPDDAVRLQKAAELAVGAQAVCLAMSFRDAEPTWDHLACVLSCMEGTRGKEANLGFMLIRLESESNTSASRAAQLERHLVNIAAEIESSGILDGLGKVPNLARLPKMQLLTVRQWEIVTRLLRGERVPQIAKELFVSQSTIRNHLSQVFTRFGVHSQAELIAQLRSEIDS